MCIMANRFHTSHLEHCFSSPLVWFVIVICENRRKKKRKRKNSARSPERVGLGQLENCGLLVVEKEYGPTNQAVSQCMIGKSIRCVKSCNVCFANVSESYPGAKTKCCLFILKWRLIALLRNRYNKCIQSLNSC